MKESLNCYIKDVTLDDNESLKTIFFAPLNSLMCQSCCNAVLMLVVA